MDLGRREELAGFVCLDVFTSGGYGTFFFSFFGFRAAATSTMGDLNTVNADCSIAGFRTHPDVQTLEAENDS